MNIKPVDPFVSIITIVYNDSKNIEKTIKSVLNQTNNNYEYIIIDAKSTDGTLDMIQQYKSKIHTIISEPDKGIYDGMNKGISLSSGKLIGLLNSGDTYEENAIEILFSCYDPLIENCVYYGDSLLNYTDTGIKFLSKANYFKMFYSMSISHQSIFVTKSTHLNYGLYSIKYKCASDYNFFLSLILKNVPFIYLNNTISCFATGGVSDSKVFISRYESIKIHFNLKNPKRYKATLLYIKEILLQFTYNFIIILVGKKGSSKIRSYYFSIMHKNI